MPSKKYLFGIVGCGMISEFHARAIADLKNAELVAVSDIVERAAKNAGKKFGVDWYTDHRKMYQRGDIDVVTVGSPSGAHMKPAVDAAKAGINVIVEKPLEVTLRKCDRIIEACKKARVTLATVFPSRFSEANQIVKDAIDKGRFGRLTLGDTYVKWWRTQEYYDSGGWRGTWELDGGGALMNQSIHNVDLLQWLMGPVDCVMAFTDCLAHKRIEVEDTATAVLRFKNRALGVIEGTTSVYPGLLKRIEIHGDKGSAIVQQDDIIKWEFAGRSSKDSQIRRKFARPSTYRAGASDPKAISHKGHMRQFADFLKALDRRGKPLVDGPEGRKSVEIILAIYKSSKTGRKVSLPL